MKVVQAYDATNNELPIPSLQAPIAPSTILPPSLVLSLSPMFVSRDFLPPEEISPKYTKTSESPTSVSPSSLIGFSSPVRTSTSEAPSMTQDDTKKLVADSVSAALEAQTANMANIDNTTRPRETPVFSRSNYTEDCKVKFAIGTLTEDALSWWNSYAKPIGIEQADKIAWTKLKRLLTNKYCPRAEVKKMEDEFYNLVVKGNDLKTYIRRL
nr:reverse transcriptase domain-containing protein [Tanacetum cinerariifolium]